MSEHTHTEFVPCCFRCELSRDEVPPSLTLHGYDTLMWVVDGVPVATAIRDEVLAALGAEWLCMSGHHTVRRCTQTDPHADFGCHWAVKP